MNSKRISWTSMCLSRKASHKVTYWRWLLITGSTHFPVIISDRNKPQHHCHVASKQKKIFGSPKYFWFRNHCGVESSVREGSVSTGPSRAQPNHVLSSRLFCLNWNRPVSSLFITIRERNLTPNFHKQQSGCKAILGRLTGPASAFLERRGAGAVRSQDHRTASSHGNCLICDTSHEYIVISWGQREFNLRLLCCSRLYYSILFFYHGIVH